jgi:hypothetical protein
LKLNKISLRAPVASLATSFGLGHPLYSGRPGTVGQASSLSKIPSPSVSGQGQPLFSAGPATVGQASSLSITPSPSVSGQGQPLFSTGPATSGH